MERYSLGIDIGTTSVKALLISESGALIDKEVLELLKKFRVFEENCEEKLKDYI